MKQTHLIAFLFAASLMACSSDDESAGTSPNSERRLTVVVNEVATRGTEINTGNLSSFYLNYQSNKYEASKGNNGWNTVPESWPNVDNDAMIDFYAYNYEFDNPDESRHSFNYNSGTPYISFIADENASKTKDFLVAHTKNSYEKGYNGIEGAISLTFDHACAAVDFTISSTKSETVTIREIVLNKIRKTGQYYYGSGWNAPDEDTQYTDYTLYSAPSGGFTLTYGAEAYPLSEANNSCGTMFLIPQKLSSVLVRYTIDGEKKKVTISLDDPEDMDKPLTVEKGRHYYIDLEL